MTIDDISKGLIRWSVAVIEMIFATATFEAFFSHASSLFWAMILTITIYFLNRYLKKKYP